jgi:NTP pyrophosphatase (non-canonical NTP hydrolase)
MTDKIELCEKYQEKAHSTSKNTVIFGSKLLYPFFGLCGESGELLEKVIKIEKDLLNWTDTSWYTLHIEEMKKEAGDVTWYIAEICTQLGIKIEDLPKCEPWKETTEKNNTLIMLSELSITSSKLMEKLKKMFRDGDVTSDSAIINDSTKKEIIMKMLGEMMEILNAYCKTRLASSLVEVTQINIDKLFSRKERGVISGSGDNR